jgi:RNA polymerase sigma factor (sigma-70 family)
VRLRATVRLRNEEMLAARARLGLTQKALADAANVPITVVCALEALQFDACRPTNLARYVRRVAGILEISPECVMPPELVGARIESERTAVQEVPAGLLLDAAQELRGRLLAQSPSTAAEEVEARAKVRDVVATLPEREQRALQMRFGIGRAEASDGEIAKALRVSRARANQIVKRAVERLGGGPRRAMLEALNE